MDNERLYLIVNQHSRSGRGARILSEVIKEIRGRGFICQVFQTEYKGHATKITRDLMDQSGNTILNLIVIGGDGTINEVINGVTDFSRIRLGVVPAGSGNDFVRGQKLKSSAKTCIDRILAELEQSKSARQIDIGEVRWEKGRRRFVISSGVGMDAEVCRLVEKSRLKRFLNLFGLGQMIYLVLTVKALFTMDTATLSLIRGNRQYTYRNMIFTAAMNSVWEGGGVPMAPGADPSDGRLSACMVFGIPKAATFFLLPFLALGRHEDVRNFRFFDEKAFRLKLDHPMAIHTDGEYLGTVDQAVYRCLEGVLTVL